MSLASGTKALGAPALGNQYEFVADHIARRLVLSTGFDQAE
jgi:hypothetical protein